MTIEVLDTSENKRTRAWRNGRYTLTWREYEAKPRLYVHLDEGNDGRKHEYNQMEHLLFDRWNNPVDMYKAFIPDILKAIGAPEGTKARWSQKAGCGCGCSPAFILSYPTGYGHPFSDFWATLGEPEAVAKANEWRAQGRAIQARKYGRDLLTNAQKAFAQGETVVKVKELATFVSTYDYKWKQTTGRGLLSAHPPPNPPVELIATRIVICQNT